MVFFCVMHDNVNEAGCLSAQKFYDSIGYSFQNECYFVDAITYPSVELKDSSQFQRLEFLGDKVLSFVVSSILFDHFKDASEFDLTIMHSNMICKNTLFQIGLEIGLDKIIFMKQSDIDSNQQKNSSIIENSLESLIGAIYCDGGLISARNFIENFWTKFLNSKFICNRDPKSVLQEITQKIYKKLPVYKMISETGESHKAIFEISVQVENLYCVDKGTSKRDAERKCAVKMLKLIKDSMPNEN